MKHILFISDNFPPEFNAPANRTYEHCNEWIKLGYQVTVITCFPNFPEGKLFEGYTNKLFAFEGMNKIKVLRVWTYIAANEGFLKRTIDYISFMFSSVLLSYKIKNVDVVVGTSPQFFTLMAAYLISKIKKIKLILEIRDLWPDSIVALGQLKNKFIIKFLETIEYYLYRKADLIISVTKSFKKIMISNGINSSKIKVIRNGINLDKFYPRPKNKDLIKKYNLQKKFVLGYVGTVGLSHKISTILECAKKMMREESFKEIVFLIIGTGADKNFIEGFVSENRLTNTIFINNIPRTFIDEYYSIIDCSLVHLRKEKLFQTVIPSKIFESIGMGIPIIHGVKGESLDIINDHKVGLDFESEDYLDLAKKIKALYLDKNYYGKLKNNCLVARNNFNRKILAKKMIGYIEKVL